MIERPIQISQVHRVAFTRRAFDRSNPVLAQLVAAGTAAPERPAKLLVVIDAGVAEALPVLGSEIEAWVEANAGLVRLAAPAIVLPGGEAAKNDWSLVERIWAAINRAGLDRHSYVVAIGGGALLDLVGFAAATAHRGIRHVRMPTTTLSQGDGGVGVKNGVNHFGKKNWVGTFCVPFAVVNDFRFLEVLPERQKRAGLIEAVKVALIRDRAFFEWMEGAATALGLLEREAVERAIETSAALHVDHIATGGDPFEFGSARPLDFGHWAAHKLEQVSEFAVGHGEAVAVGMAIDLLYSVRAGILPAAEAERVLHLIEGIGFSLYSEHLERRDPEGRPLVLQGLEEFREHLGGRLTITLVPEIGRKIEVHEMDSALVAEAMATLAERAGARTE